MFTMQYQEVGIVEVIFGPHGLAFDPPVAVRVDLNGTTATPDDDITLYWFDENSGDWVDVGGDWDSESMILTCELEHFSSYRPGRAGW